MQHRLIVLRVLKIQKGKQYGLKQKWIRSNTNVINVETNILPVIVRKCIFGDITAAERYIHATNVIKNLIDQTI
jgi:hypothetical protein